MERGRSLLVLACALVVAGLATFATDLGPRPLDAQAACGAYNGKACADDCTRECTDGSCCRWVHYYYATAVDNP